VKFERRRGGGVEEEERMGRSRISHSIKWWINEIEVGKLSFILGSTKGHFALFP